MAARGGGAALATRIGGLLIMVTLAATYETPSTKHFKAKVYRTGYSTRRPMPFASSWGPKRPQKHKDPTDPGF